MHLKIGKMVLRGGDGGGVGCGGGGGLAWNRKMDTLL